jgi:hypothetical protein
MVVSASVRRVAFQAQPYYNPSHTALLNRRYTKEEWMAECIFCRVGRGEIPADTLFEDEFVMAFRDIHPVAPVHVLGGKVMGWPPFPPEE